MAQHLDAVPAGRSGARYDSLRHTPCCRASAGRLLARPVHCFESSHATEVECTESGMAARASVPPSRGFRPTPAHARRRFATREGQRCPVSRFLCIGRSHRVPRTLACGCPRGIYTGITPRAAEPPPCVHWTCLSAASAGAYVPRLKEADHVVAVNRPIRVHVRAR